MQLLENFKHAETFAQMPIGERMQATLYVILLGMSITFVALLIIWGCTILLSKVVRAIEKKSQPAVVPAPKVATPTPAVATQDDSELVAVITAAIAASMNTSVHNIIVTNIVRTGDGTPVWGRMGRSDVMNSRL